MYNTNTLGDFERVLLAEIKAMQDARIAMGKHPTYTTHADVRDRVNAALNALYKAQAIEVGKTLNDKWIKAL